MINFSTIFTHNDHFEAIKMKQWKKTYSQNNNDDICLYLVSVGCDRIGFMLEMRWVATDCLMRQYSDFLNNQINNSEADAKCQPTHFMFNYLK